MNLAALSNEKLLQDIKSLMGTERETTLAILYHLIEVESRGIYRDEGYASLFDFCTRGLGYSGGSAWRRIEGAHALREKPELAELLLSGEVTLCSMATAAKALSENTAKVSDIVGKSKREVELLVSPPVAKRKERVRAIMSVVESKVEF